MTTEIADCPICHGAGWYKEEAAPVTRECDCQDHIADARENGQEALASLNQIALEYLADHCKCDDANCDVCVNYRNIRLALNAIRKDQVNHELLEALKDLLDAVKKSGKMNGKEYDTLVVHVNDVISRAETQKGE